MGESWSFTSLLKDLWDRFLALVGTILLTAAFFLVLPLIQAITAEDEPDLMVRTVEAGSLPPPAPPMVEEEVEDLFRRIGGGTLD